MSPLWIHEPYRTAARAQQDVLAAAEALTRTQREPQRPLSVRVRVESAPLVACVEGGQAGNREDKINALIRRMN